MSERDVPLPLYELKDEDGYIEVAISAPLSQPEEAVFKIEENFLIFESKPYLQKIKLPHPVCDKSIEQCFSSSTATYRIKLKKIIAVSSNNKEENVNENASDISDFSNSHITDTNTISTILLNNEEKQYYGFANKFSNMFGKLYYEFSEVINLPDPDFTKLQDRRKLRIEEENQKWSDDHYLADTMETDHLESVFNYVPPWIKSPITDELSKDEIEMLELNNCMKNKFVLCEDIKKLCEFQIVDILLCYAYNKRITEGDDTVESGWTINKLSSTLSWFEVFEDMKSVILSFYRRCLTFPLFRNWKLAEMVHKDVVSLLLKGPKQITHCLLEVKEIFYESENRNILNTLYVSDLCQYSYFMTTENSIELSKEVEKIQIRKYEVNFDLPYLEIAAHLTLEEELNGTGEKKDIKAVIDNISKLNLEKGNSFSSESSNSSESDSDEFSSADEHD